jgi:hypothetical protein
MSLRCFNPQFFIGSRVGDAALEADYGALARRSRQEVRIVVDALQALTAVAQLEHMPPSDRLAVDRLHWLAQELDRSGTGDHEGAVFSTAEVDDLIRRLRRIRSDDPESADRILRRLTQESAPSSPDENDNPQ